ncbi:MAG TPA: hypothetical protein VLL52_15645 [Anaerolineae bacterium]|nr:hypothetical protein [Anaerolineae bacterium]
MDSFFGVGPAELVMIMLLAGLVLGPQRIRDVARYLGRFTAAMQTVSREFVRQLNAELDGSEGGGDIKDVMAEMKALREEVVALRQQNMSVPRRALDKVKEEVQANQAAVAAVLAGEKLPEEELSKKETQTIVAEQDDGALDEDNGPEPQIAPPQMSQAPQLISLPTAIEVADDPE